MNIFVEPIFTKNEEAKFEKFTSFDFSYFWDKKTDASNIRDLQLLAKGIRVMENRLVKLRNGSCSEQYMLYVRLGHANLLIKAFAIALSAYQHAYKLDDNNFWKDPSTYFGIGLVYFHFKSYEAAGVAFSRLLYSYPNLELAAEVHSRLGIVYENSEQFELAIKHFNLALIDIRGNKFLSKTELRFHIAHCFDIAGDLERAFTEYRNLLSDHTVQLSNSLRAKILRQLGWICYRTETSPETRSQKIFEAEQYLSESKDLEPLCGKTYYYLGRCYGDLPDRAHDAFANYRLSIDKSEADADTWCSIGVLYQQQTQPMDALQAFICAVQLNGEHSEAWSDLGRLYEVNCQFSDALHCFKKALSFNPVAPEALKARIRVLEKELHPSSLLAGNLRALPPNKLPSLEDAWKLPIPSELNQRQEGFLRQKQQRYRDERVLLSAPPMLPLAMRDEETPMDTSFPVVSQDDLMKVLGSDRAVRSEGDDVGATTSTSGGMQIKRERVEEDSTQETEPNKRQVEISPLPQSFSLDAPLHVPLTISASELFEKCRKRVDNPSEFEEIFDERVPPPKLPNISPPNEKSENVSYKAPIVVIDTKKDAHSFELQDCCYKSPIKLIRNLTSILRMDLSLFSTKSMLEIAPDQEVEIRTQYKMSSDENVDHLGNPTWVCHSTRSYTTVARYAQYQAQSFQYSLKEEAEKLRAASAKYGGGSQDGNGPSSKRRRPTFYEEPQMPMKLIKFGTNVDLSDENRFKIQLMELNKMPAFCRLVAGCNMLTYLGHNVFGMNTVQLYMKVPGARTPGHVENNCLASVNINIGPGDCEWFAVPFNYWSAMEELLKDRGLDFLKGSWWPDLDELAEARIPVQRFTQKAGDVVWVGSGCIHWVHSTGWCNNVAWNVGPLTMAQLQMAVVSHEWNRLNGYKSLVPLQHLCWQLARHVRFTKQEFYAFLRQILTRSLAYTKMIADMLNAANKPIKMHLRQKGEVSHYCTTCEIEVWNLLFVREINGKYPVYCVQCARKADLANFIVLQQYTFEDLCYVYDQFRLNQPTKTPLVA